jgi:integrase
MARQRLTAKFVENVTPGAARREIPDSGCTGLYLISQPSGHRSWAVRYRGNNGKPVKLTIGAWPSVSLHDARIAAMKAREQVAKGVDPAKAKQTAKLKAMEAEANTVASVCAAYMKREGVRLRTSDQRESILRRLVYPRIGDKPIGSIKRSDLVAMLDKIEDNSGPRAADVTLAVLRRVFTWHALRDDDFANPIVRGMARLRPSEHRRDRTLDDDEIRKLWAVTADGSVFSGLVRFLLLSAARRNEAAGMKWDEIDDKGIWTLPASRSKSKVPVTRPLSKAALALIEQMPRIDGCPFVFASATGHTPISQFSKPKRRLDVASGVRGWVLHDARRTSRSIMSRAGIDVDIAERLLGHSRGDLRERYDRYHFVPQMTRAVERLSMEIGRIVSAPPEGAAVIPMRRRRR